MALERLQKVMARAGIASRRACEEMIAAGRVEVNGQVVTEMGVKVDPAKDHIRVDGELLRVHRRPQLVYWMLYKPPGYLSVFHDERNRPGLELLIQTEERLFAVGRLDRESEGLMLLTNDGDLAQQLSHPRYGHVKTYLVQVDRQPGSDDLARLRRGLRLEDGMTAPSEWQVLARPPAVWSSDQVKPGEGAWLRVRLREGRKRQIRRMVAARGLQVLRLIRVGLGPLQLDRNLRPGQSRQLSTAEVERLRKAMARSRRRQRRGGRSVAVRLRPRQAAHGRRRRRGGR